MRASYDRMNRHKKTAIIVAPFLAIGGYVATDYYTQYERSAQQLYKLSVTNNCDLANDRCELTGGGLSLRLSNINGKTKVVSSHPLNMMTISVLDAGSGESIYRMEMDGDQKHWVVMRDIFTDRVGSSLPLTMRISAVVENAYFISEFKAVQTAGEQSAAK